MTEDEDDLDQEGQKCWESKLRRGPFGFTSLIKRGQRGASGFFFFSTFPFNHDLVLLGFQASVFTYHIFLLQKNNLVSTILRNRKVENKDAPPNIDKVKAFDSNGFCS